MTPNSSRAGRRAVFWSLASAPGLLCALLLALTSWVASAQAQTADLAVLKAVNNATPNVGDTVTFTVTVSNNGPDVATNVALTDVLPAGLVFVSATPSQGTYTLGTGAWTIGSINPGTPQTLALAATVVSANPSTNTATITTSDQSDPNAANNSGSAAVTPQQANLAVAKSVNNATPNVGDTVTFTVTVTNNGPNAATNVVLIDVLPAGLAFVSAIPSQGSYNAGTGAWTIGSVIPGTPQTLALVTTVVSANPATNTATIATSDQFDPNSANNSASATVTPQQADLAVTKTVNNATPNVGATVTFTVTVSNFGPVAATNVALTDVLPAGLTFVSATPSQGVYNSGTGAWTIGTLANGASSTVAVQAQVVSLPSTNVATITNADQFDPNTENNSASAALLQQSDLAVTKTVNNATPNVGAPVTFTVTVSNNGPDIATNVAVTDVLPAGLTFVSATPSQGAYSAGTGVWTIGSINPGTPQTLALVTTVVGPNPSTNTATIANSDQFDPNAANNSASVTVTPQRADLAVTKTVNNPGPNVGATVIFNVTVTNNGPNAATNVALTDLLPAGLTFVSANPSQGAYNSGTGAWTIGTLANGANSTLAVQAQVVSLPSTNTASISNADQFDPNTANNSASAAVKQQADLAVTKVVNNATPNVGDTVTFTVTVSNNGPAGATNVSLTDLLPAGLTLVSATPSQGSYIPGTGLWTIGSLNPGTPQTLALAATVVSANPATNTATIASADQFDPNAANNSASVTVTPQRADLAVTKTVSNATPNVGDTVTFTVTVSNGGPNGATNVALTDVLPAGLTFVSATPSLGSYNPGTGLWTIGSINPGSPQTLTLTATVVSLPSTNTATITNADQFDPTTANNNASALISAAGAPISVAVPIDVRWMFALAGLIALAALPFLRRR